MNYLKTAVSISLINFFLLSIPFILAHFLKESSAPTLAYQTQIQPTSTTIPSPLPSSPITPTPVLVKPKITPQLTTESPAPLTQTPANPSTSAVNDQCLVTIDGMKYNVAELRKTHSGGDVFQCGTDMTQIFYSRHDKSYLGKLQRV